MMILPCLLGLLLQLSNSLAATAYNGYLYIMGGESGSAAGSCTATSDYCNDVQYAAIASNGSLSEPSSCVALASGNSIWCTTNILPTARQGLNTVAYNGYLYITGGQASSSFADCTATSDYCNGVYYAPIDSNGTIGLGRLQLQYLQLLLCCFELSMTAMYFI